MVCVFREAEPIALGEIDVEIPVAVGSLFQFYGDGSRFVLLFPSGHVFRTRDVLVVRDAAVFVHFQEKVVVYSLYLILFADVASKQSGIEVRGRLVLIVAASVQVIHIEAESQSLVYIH